MPKYNLNAHIKVVTDEEDANTAIQQFISALPEGATVGSIHVDEVYDPCKGMLNAAPMGTGSLR